MEYKYCLYRIIDGLVRITLTDNWELLKVGKNLLVLYDVSVAIMDDGYIVITGMEDEVHYTYEEQRLSELKHIPRVEDVKRKRPRRLFGFSFGEDYCYVKGWYRTVPTHRVKYEFTNYCVKTYR